MKFFVASENCGFIHLTEAARPVEKNVVPTGPGVNSRLQRQTPNVLDKNWEQPSLGAGKVLSYQTPG
jgi:hypothetical protein